MPPVSSSSPSGRGCSSPVRAVSSRVSTRKNTTKPQTWSIPSPAPRTAPGKAEPRACGADGEVRPSGDEVLRVSKAVSTAADTWISQSHTPARRLPKQPAPATPKAKAGPQLLQNSSSRCPSCRETAPVRASSPAVWAPTG